MPAFVQVVEQEADLQRRRGAARRTGLGRLGSGLRLPPWFDGPPQAVSTMVKAAMTSGRNDTVMACPPGKTLWHSTAEGRAAPVPHFARAGADYSEVGHAARVPAVEDSTNCPGRLMTTADATPPTLLLVDDEELNRDMLGRRLERQGYRVVPAEDGLAALAVLDRTPIDLVLLDVMMPGLSGLDVLRRIRARHGPDRLPVIMVTAKAQSEDVVDALDLGANDYITKPVDFPVALARIRAQVTRGRAEQALREREERYALAVEGTNEGVWEWKVGTGEVFYSPRWMAIMGATDACDPRLESWSIAGAPRRRAAGRPGV